MNFLRRIHLYLGCFFAPMLVFFSISGIWQVYGLQWVKGPNILTYLSTIHMGHQLFFKDPAKAYTFTSPYLEFFVVLMAANRPSLVQISVVSDSTTMLPMISRLSEIGRTMRSRYQPTVVTASMRGGLTSSATAELGEPRGRT